MAHDYPSITYVIWFITLALGRENFVFLSCYFRLNACEVISPLRIDLIENMTLNIKFSKADIMVFAQAASSR